jgi:hypothetical protein
MGEMADMMIEGDLCAGCGGFIDTDGGDGFPRYCCDACDPDAPDTQRPRPQKHTKPEKSLDGMRQSISDRTICLIEKEMGGKFSKKTRRGFAMAMQALLEGFLHVDGSVVHKSFEENNHAKHSNHRR